MGTKHECVFRKFSVKNGVVWRENIHVGVERRTKTNKKMTHITQQGSQINKKAQTSFSSFGKRGWSTYGETEQLFL